MELFDAIKTGLFAEYAAGMPAGHRVWSSRKGMRKMGRVATGKGLSGKISVVRKINKEAVAGRLAKKANELKNPLLTNPSSKALKHGKALENASKRLMNRK